MATKVISGTHTSTVALATYPAYSDFSLTGVITVAASAGVFGSATKAWTVANSGLVSGANGMVFNSGGLASTVSNTGTIVGTATSGSGVLLQSGGIVENQGLIQGTFQGIRISGATGSVSNSGTVLSTSGSAVGLSAGGTVANLGTIASSASYGISLTAGFIANGSSAVTTAVVSGYQVGVVATPSAATTAVVNYGTIAATSTSGTGVALLSGGSIANTSLISGGGSGILINGGVGSVTNTGTIRGITGRGVYLGTGSGMTNGVSGGTVGLISSYTYGVLGNSGVTVTNHGTIAASGTTGVGVVLGPDGSISNAGLISGVGSGVLLNGGGALANTGTVQGVTGRGVYLSASSNLTNGVSGGTVGLIASYTYGVLGNNNVTVTNHGTIAASGTTGVGAVLGAGGSISNAGLMSGVGAGVLLNGGGTLANTGTVQGVTGRGVYLSAGSNLTNGVSGGTVGLIASYTYGIVANGDVTVANYGTIAAASTSSIAVVLLSGGSIANDGLISGAGAGISVNGGGTLANTGTIQGLAGRGVYLGAGSSLTNGLAGSNVGLIASYTYGVITYGNVVVTNHGTIAALGTAGTGVVLGTGTSTLVNSGTIIGNSGYAAYLGNGDLLVIYPQAVFAGTILAGGSDNTLELAAGAGIGTLGTFGYDLSGLGTDLRNFDALIVDASATWEVAQSGGNAHTVTNQGTIVVPTLGMLVTASLSAGGGTGTVVLGNRTSVEIVGSVDTGETVRFLDATGTLFLHAPENFAGTIDGFQTGDVIELVSTAATGLVYSGSSSAGTLTVMNGGTVVATLALTGGTAYGPSAFVLTQAGEAGAGILRITLGQPQTTSSGGLFFNVIYDASMANAPAGFLAGFNQAIQFLEANFVDPIAINLELGWGEVAGTPLDPNQLGEGQPLGGNFYTYDQVKAILAANVDSPAAASALANLPDQDPTNGGLFYIGGAESKALGLIPADATDLDAAVGMQIDPTIGFVTPGCLHEITEAMGRIALLGQSNLYSVFDLFRYTGAGVLDPTATTGAYFSIDGGNTVINTFADGTGQTGHQDFADWGGSTPDAFNNPGPVGQFSSGDFTVIDVLGYDVACFRRGTRIRTDRGEVPVEELAIGDRVVTVSGARRPIKWIGRRAYDGRFVSGNRNILPVRIEAGALADGVPARDLYVSPEHAMVVDGLLLPARLLLNGATIRQVERVDVIQYFHIELHSHDVILAEGAAAETFVDFGSRGMFHNAAEFAVRYPVAAPADWAAYAALLEEGEAGLLAVRARLLARAERLGRISIDPDLHLLADGSLLPPRWASASLYRFTLPAGVRNVTIASRSAVPAETEANSADRRALGVAVERVVLRAGARQLEIGPDCVALRHGFHANEGSHRWTDGHARLPPEVLAAFDGEISLELHLSETELHYPTDAVSAADTRAAPLAWGNTAAA